MLKSGVQQSETQTMPLGADSLLWRGKPGNLSGPVTDGVGPRNQHLTEFGEFRVFALSHRTSRNS